MGNFDQWLKEVKKLMVITNIIKPSTILSPEGYKPYYEEGLPPITALREEFGMDWVKAFQKWYYFNNH